MSIQPKCNECAEKHVALKTERKLKLLSLIILLVAIFLSITLGNHYQEYFDSIYYFFR